MGIHALSSKSSSSIVSLGQFQQSGSISVRVRLPAYAAQQPGVPFFFSGKAHESGTNGYVRRFKGKILIHTSSFEFISYGSCTALQNSFFDIARCLLSKASYAD